MLSQQEAPKVLSQQECQWGGAKGWAEDGCSEKEECQSEEEGALQGLRVVCPVN